MYARAGVEKDALRAVGPSVRVAAVDDHQVGSAVPVEVADGHSFGRHADRKRRDRSERAVAVAEQGGHAVVGIIGFNQVDMPVLVEIPSDQ